MKKNKTYRLYLLLIGILGAVLLSACQGEELMTDTSTTSADAVAEARPLIQHQVSVALDGAATRVAYKPLGDGLQLSWAAEETLGVYIKKSNGKYTYAGNMTSTGTAGTGVRYFTGTVRAKRDDETYVYLHPALAGETQGSAAQGTIDFTNQSADLDSTTHLSSLIPLIWHEGSPFPTYHGYALHLSLAFNQDPGTISSVTLQTMDKVDPTAIFPTTFEAATMKGGSTKNNAITLNVTSGTAKQIGSIWTTDAYLACTNTDVNVFRTKFNVKVVATNGTFYNEYRSFPGQESATSQTLPMLANGKCYNLGTTMSKGAVPTIISTQYKVNSLMGMWNEYGEVKDPFTLTKTTGWPTQLESLLGAPEKKTAFTTRTLTNASSQGTPTFTWTMVTNQCSGNYKQSDVTYNNIEIVDKPTEVYVTFISEYAWSQNLLGYYHYPTGHVPASSNDVLKTIIFPNVSKGGHVPYNKGGTDGGANINPNTEGANVGTDGNAPLTEYTTVQLLYNNPDGTYSKEFPAGTTIGFFIMRDPKASSSGHDEGTMGGNADADLSTYQPRTDNTLLDWNSWRLFTNTRWNSASGNTGWWDMNCHNFFCSADVGDKDNGGVIPGLAIYGAKDDASHNYNYSFSAMLYMVSASTPSSMRTHNNSYFNIGTGAQVIKK